MSINFILEEKYSEILVLVSEEAYADSFRKTKSDDAYSRANSLIKLLEVVKTKFAQNRIDVSLEKIFKNLVIIKGIEERSNINEYFDITRVQDNWRSCFSYKSETIIFDIEHFESEELLLNSLVHEIGHAIHLRFISDDAKNYISSIGKKYTEIIDSFKEVKSIINRIEEIKNDTDWFSQIISSYTGFLLEAFTKMKQNNITVEQMPEAEDFCESLAKYAEILFYDFASLLDNSLDKHDMRKTSNISNQIRKEYRAANKPTYLSKIDAMISAIMEFIPSEYGASNESEFFAECFRKFILSPDMLSLNNRNMIINAFAMSRAQGKELMRAHKLIKDYVRQILS